MELDPYPRVGADPYHINATVILKPMHLSKLHRLMVLIPPHSPHLHVELQDPRAPNGTKLPIVEENRNGGEQKVILDGRGVLDAGGTFTVPLVIHTSANGRFHFGVYVAGFDESWQEFTVAPGFTAETFGGAAVSGVGHPREWFDPPFRGDGNAIPSAPVALLVAAVAGGVCLLRRRGPRDFVDDDAP